MMHTLFPKDSFHSRNMMIVSLKGLFWGFVVLHVVFFLSHATQFLILKHEQGVMLETIASQKKERALIQDRIVRFERGDQDFIDEQRRRYLGLSKSDEFIVEYQDP